MRSISTTPIARPGLARPQPFFRRSGGRIALPGLARILRQLLPEDKLREAMEKHHAGNVRAGNDFDLLAALGVDLPGAVRVLPNDGTRVAEDASKDRSKARFLLAGVPMKLSVMKNTGKGGGLTFDGRRGRSVCRQISIDGVPRRLRAIRSRR
jgi:hypothetical protein